MGDPEGVLDELRNRRGGRPERVPPPRRNAGGEPRRPAPSALSGAGTATLDAPASGTSDDLASTWGDAAPIAPASAPAAVAAPSPPPASAPSAAPAAAPAPVASHVSSALAPAPEPAADTRGPVNVHARIQAPDNDRLERIMHQLRRMGWPTNKVEIIGMLVHELPEPADEALAERLLAYRRDIINATEG